MLTLVLMKEETSRSQRQILSLQTFPPQDETSHRQKSQATGTLALGAHSSPALVLLEARGALGQALLLMDDKPGGVPEIFGYLAQATAVLGGHAAPPFVLVSEVWAGAQAVPVEVEVAAGDAGMGVPGAAATPQTLRVAAFLLACTSSTSDFARTH